MHSLHDLLHLLLLLQCLFLAVQSATDPSDVQALGNLYSSLNSPSQLSGWTENGGDPCGESWKGISCSGSSVTSIQISGLGLNGTFGYLLSNLLSLKTMDLSNNNIHDTIPYQIPPNVTYMNIASNNLSGNLPYSISTSSSLVYLNVSHNLLSQTIGDLFANLQNLVQLDLSVNNFTGDLPNSIGSLSNLSSLYIQDNQLTGQVNILTNLSLTTLNIANNHFSGWIPQEFKAIPNLIIGGNSFANSPAPPPPPYAPPPPRKRHDNHNHSRGPTETPSNHDSHPNYRGGRNSFTSGQIIGIVVGSVLGGLCVILAAIFCFWNFHKGKYNARSKTGNPLISVTVAGSEETWDDFHPHVYGIEYNYPSFRCQATNQQQQKQNISASVANLKPPPVDKTMVEKVRAKNGSANRPKSPIAAIAYSVASLQSATNSFSQECLVGEGSIGRVYRAEFSIGKVLAVKKIDNAALSLQEEDNFLEAVSSMSRLKHPNITELVGYCVEHGQRLLVYDYIGNGTLHDMLHYAEDNSVLTWNARVRVALGTARALEYLHEVCLPSVVHRNFKSANILLDEELNPYLSDCGLAALTPNTERQISTEMVGSFGYSAPEFALSGVYTVKSDVYSFGVVMLELLTGRKPLDSSRERSEQSIVRWAAPQLHDIDALAKMVDPALNGMYPAKSLSRFADIIALCVQPEPEFRPPMSEVVQSLVRLMQRASVIRRRSGEDLGTSYRISEHEAYADISF